MTHADSRHLACCLEPSSGCDDKSRAKPHFWSGAWRHRAIDDVCSSAVSHGTADKKLSSTLVGTPPKVGVGTQELWPELEGLLGELGKEYERQELAW